ncbi:MAG TPA: hypothetical protein VHV55_14640 [Pirellulales bacterium]|jgi:hypothetical protein|nr:hypothetical protein [Pirellulales bacterium]
MASDDGLEEWLSIDPDDIPDAMAFAEGDKPPSRKSPWPLAMALLAMVGFIAWWLLK